VSQVWGGDSFLLVTDLAVGEPAITTNGKPIAGPGVSRALLGRVYRKGVSWQVTYAGHPLYLFDQGPARSPARAGSSRACRRGTASGG
jgi:hypothetical protein